MSYSFEYIDIILLAMIAGFIFLRLRGILGKRSGFEGKTTAQFDKILKEADATYDNILKLDLYFNDKSDRKFVNPVWLEIFPDENKRPARHSHLAILEDPCIVQIVFTALI